MDVEMESEGIRDVNSTSGPVSGQQLPQLAPDPVLREGGIGTPGNCIGSSRDIEKEKIHGVPVEAGDVMNSSSKDGKMETLNDNISTGLSSLRRVEEAESSNQSPLKCCSCQTVVISRGAETEATCRNLNEFTNCAVFDSKKQEVEVVEVKIIKMLTTLYTFSKRHKEIRKVLKKDLWICEKCIQLVGQLYQLYNEYLAIIVRSDSVLSKVITTRNKLESSKIYTKKPFGNNSSAHLVSSSEQLPKNSSRNVGRTSKKVNVGKPLAISRPKRVIKSIIREASASRFTSIIEKFPNSRNNVKEKTEVNQNKPLSSSVDDTKKPAPTSLELESELALMSEHRHSSATKRDSLHHCTRCSKQFKSAVGLKVHYASHLREDNKYECKECGKKFRKQDVLDLHVKIEHEGFKPHKCPHVECNKSFRLKDKLKLHIQVMHEKRKPFPCAKCEKSFRTKYHLKVHDVSQHIQRDNSIGCSQCKRKFASRDELAAHVKIHEENKPFTCKVCQKGFHTLPRLKLHSKSHAEIPACICSICGKAYKHVRDLRLHEVVHQDESTYRFACGDCPKKFYRIDLLRVHQSNEQHFSPQQIGPSISKSKEPKCRARSEAKRRKRKGVINDTTSANLEQQIFDEIEMDTIDMEKSSKISSKAKGRMNLKRAGNSWKVNRSANLFLSTPDVYQPNLSTVADDDTTIRNTFDHAIRLESVQSDSSTSKIGTIDTMEALLKDKVIDLPENAANTANPIQSFQSPLTSRIHVPRNAGYPIRETAMDRGLPSFCISTGAEQIGFDVISAFINNL